MVFLGLSVTFRGSYARFSEGFCLQYSSRLWLVSQPQRPSSQLSQIPPPTPSSCYPATQQHPKTQSQHVGKYTTVPRFCSLRRVEILMLAVGIPVLILGQVGHGQRACLGNQVAFCFEKAPQLYNLRMSRNHMILTLPWLDPKDLHENLGRPFTRNFRKVH